MKQCHLPIYWRLWLSDRFEPHAQLVVLRRRPIGTAPSSSSSSLSRGNARSSAGARRRNKPNDDDDDDDKDNDNDDDDNVASQVDAGEANARIELGDALLTCVSLDNRDLVNSGMRFDFVWFFSFVR